MGKSLQSKYVPGINFYYDDELSNYDKINKILKDGWWGYSNMET